MTDVELEPIDPKTATEMLRERAARREMELVPTQTVVLPDPVHTVPRRNIWKRVMIVAGAIGISVVAGLVWSAEHAQSLELNELQKENTELDKARAQQLALAGKLQQELNSTTGELETLRTDSSRKTAQLEQQLKTENEAADKARAENAQLSAKQAEAEKTIAELQQQLASEKSALTKPVTPPSPPKKDNSSDTEALDRQLKQEKSDLDAAHAELQKEKAAYDKAEKEDHDLQDKLKHAQDDKAAAIKQLQDQLAQANKRIHDLEQQLAHHHK
jgi:hypothetical protein